ncbi:hypothetical protein SELMODRAFT_83040 [Selaginella moellendorffii]|uniref:Uncharacterized protein n=1 Tax=Selaginella moellendorffii TaxID=88036 RepID=D8R0Y6_SELML|nr:transcription termination factor MTERF6, chloroplastic/mitochondrial [Selaginella moellendorffii]EFJ33810.1 hypothetical protein SELMODRAFT_83040 [Selaginella moellendorffii]|eukprot:XP_002964972.1 transcription termination factor MTERF6, chloroplastic/mitochondrial [Selaginella moellendorffii]
MAAVVSACSGSAAASALAQFLRSKGVREECIDRMVDRCNSSGRFPGSVDSPSATADVMQPTWSYLESIVVPKRKVTSVVARCPPLLMMPLEERLKPMVMFLQTMGLKREDIAKTINRYPSIFMHSVEEKLCPLLAFLEGAAGVRPERIGKLLVLCPRLLSYSIDQKLRPMVDFLCGLGVEPGHELGKLVCSYPNIFGYSIENRLQVTVEYLRQLGLSKNDLKKIIVCYPHIICRAEKALEPAVNYLLTAGLSAGQITTLVAGFPPILVKSVKRSIQPKVEFLMRDMGRGLEEAVEFPAYFGHSLNRKIGPRHKKLKDQGAIPLHAMLNCNKKKFTSKFFPEEVTAP